MVREIIEVGGYLASFIAGMSVGRRNRKTQTDNSDTSICSCEHPYSMHRSNGTCNVVRVKFRDGSKHNYNCPCVRYDGVPPAHIYMKDS